jgi:hypothetical protein
LRRDRVVMLLGNNGPRALTPDIALLIVGLREAPCVPSKRPFFRVAPPRRGSVLRAPFRRRREEKKSRKFHFVPRGVHDTVARLQGPAAGAEKALIERRIRAGRGGTVRPTGGWRSENGATQGCSWRIAPILRGMTLPKGPSLTCIQRHGAAGPVVANRQLQGPPW